MKGMNWEIDSIVEGLPSREGQTFKVRAMTWIAETDLSVLGTLVTEFREGQGKLKRRKRKGIVGMRGARTGSKGVRSQN